MKFSSKLFFLIYAVIKQRITDELLKDYFRFYGLNDT